LIDLPENASLKVRVGETVFNIHDGHVQIVVDDLTFDGKTFRVTADTITLEADTVNLGGVGGAKVARIGDAINTTTKKISGGSDVVKSS
jgi:hypothetical protein